MFNFKRKTKEGKVEDQPVTQEEFDTLEANSATYTQVLELFGEEAQQEDFDVVAAIQNVIDSNAAIGEAFGEEADAEDFDGVARITELLEESTELASIADLVQSCKGETTLDKVKSINPKSKTTVVKKGKETTSELTDTTPAFQDSKFNQKAIKDLKERGIKLAGVDYEKLN